MIANVARVLNDNTPGLRSKVLGIYGLLLARQTSPRGR